MSDLMLPGGKYAAFIWPAYAASVVAFAWMILDTLLRARHWRRRARDLEDDRRREG
ncbi:MAG TPA: heme exporter protein CcmD [Caulobacteraceae bacterium]|nr:heme exporter protein CcmD [Caulobacteraceae bacterium]